VWRRPENTFWGRLQEGNLSPPHQRHGQLRFGEASKGLRPKSVKVIEKRATMVTVELETTDYRSVIYESASKWKETKGRISKILELNSVPMYRFRFLDSKAEDHFARRYNMPLNSAAGSDLHSEDAKWTPPKENIMRNAHLLLGALMCLAASGAAFC
jgi:hypothetical protein